MGLSKIIDANNGSSSINKQATVSCEHGVDCMYKSASGGCTAEWCIFSQLPKIVNNSKKLKCSVCGKNEKTVSVYSGISSFVCDECTEKINKVIKDRTCPICGTSIELEEVICSNCAGKLKEAIADRHCPICGTSISLSQTMCSSCASRIRSKLNE